MRLRVGATERGQAGERGCWRVGGPVFGFRGRHTARMAGHSGFLILRNGQRRPRGGQGPAWDTGCKASCLVFPCLSFPTDYNNCCVFVALLCAGRCQALPRIIALTPAISGEVVLLCVTNEAIGMELGLEPGVVQGPGLPVPTTSQSRLSVAEGRHGGGGWPQNRGLFTREASSSPRVSAGRGGVGVSSSYLTHLCGTGHFSRPASRFHGFPGSQAPSPGQ